MFDVEVSNSKLFVIYHKKRNILMEYSYLTEPPRNQKPASKIVFSQDKITKERNMLNTNLRSDTTNGGWTVR